MSFSTVPLKIPEVILIKPKINTDMRGEFTKIFDSSLTLNGIKYTFTEDSISVSKKNVLRGLHYQLSPYLEGKLITVIHGTIFDVAVDIRKNSPNFGKYVCIELSGNTKDMIWIPPGFAHGFVALSENTTIMYKMTMPYHSDKQKGIIWNDPDLAIPWPVKKPIISNRDKEFPRLTEAEINFSMANL